MLSRVVRRSIHSTAIRAAADQAAAGAATKVTLNLNTPHESFYKGAQVDLVQIPGLVGEYGITAGHTPIISQLKPGVIAVHEEREKVVKKFFTAGGFAFTHANSTTDIACVELIKIEDIDAAAAEAGVQKYKAALEQAAEGTPEKVEAQIAYETHVALVAALASA
ncbi:ATP synthase subunit delta, mitochondrial [Aphanomyces cochlioides]|nr:ATP synthase subunit delta, mitochondrial [Aphanomyces cochlioides]